MALEWELEESLFERPSEDTTIQNAPANKKCIKGPVTDYSSTMVQWMRNRGPRDIKNPRLEQERPSASYIVDMLPPIARVMNPADTIPAKHLHSSLNKIKHPVNVVRWTPEGRRLLTGSSSGEFTLWNGMGFNFETIMQAHDSAIRAAAWSHSDDWLISADQDGVLKYWQPNFNNVNSLQAHENPVRDVAFSPTDSKFVTASDDVTLKIWDFSRGVEESVLKGHGWDAKTVDWHPTKGLLVSGSRDHQVKLWDPRTGRCLTTLHGHKNTIHKTSFEPVRGQLLATCAKDQTARVFDLRMMRDVLLLKGHERDITTLAWHPIHVSMLSTAGVDGSLYHYILDEPNPPEGSAYTTSPYDSPDPANAPAQSIYPAHRVQYAHESAIWSLDWHPLGHILASGSNDRVTRFWTRPRPGDVECFTDRYHLGDAAAEANGTWNRKGGKQQAREEEELEQEDEADGLVDQKMPARHSGLPGMTAITADGTSVGGAQMPLLPGMGVMGLPPPPPQMANGMPVPPLSLPGLAPGQLPDLATLASLFGGQLPPPPPLGLPHGQFPPPMPPGFGGAFPPPPPGAFPPPSMLPPGFPPSLPAGFPPSLPPGFPPPPPGMQIPGVSPMDFGAADGQQNGTGGRRRMPLPSQQDSLREEMKRSNVRSTR